MIINNNFSLLQNQQSKPTFKSVDYFHPIKNSPKMICGCCGKKTLPILKYIKATTSLALPLQIQIEKGVLDCLKQVFPTAWRAIEALSKKDPDKNIDEIIRSSNNADTNEYYVLLKEAIIVDVENNDEYKDLSPEKKDRIINKTFFDLNDRGRSYMKRSSIVMNELAPLAQYLEGVQQEVFDQFEYYSQKYPKKTLSEIVREPEVEQFHKQQYSLQKAAKDKQLEQHFQNILMIIEKDNPNLVPDFQDLQKQAISMLHGVKDARKRKYLLEKMYKEGLDKYHCNVNEEDIMKELNQLPESYVSKDGFFTVAAKNKFTDAEIVNAMFGNILASEKYIIPLEQGGSEKIGNKIVMCRGCNTKTKTIPYKEVIKYRTEMPENMQKQVDLISEGILKGVFNPRLRTYPIYVAETFRVASENAINLDVTDYCEETIKRSKRKVDENNKKIDWMRQTQNFEATNKIFLNEKEVLLQEKMRNFLAGKDNLHYHQ